MQPNSENQAEAVGEIEESPTVSVPSPAVAGFYMRKARELGFKLPIGGLDAKGKLVKSFSLRELSPEREKVIGEYRKANPMKPNTTTVTTMLALCQETLGDQKFKEIPPDDDGDLDLRHNIHHQNLLRIRNMSMADVFYMYLRCRIEEMGATFSAPWQCEACKETRKIEADLEDVDVICCDDPALLRVECDLNRGLIFRDGNPKKKVIVTPMLWGNMEVDEVADAGADPLLMKLFMISKCVTGVEGFEGDVSLTREENRTIGKLDRETIAQKINDMNLGPALQINGQCPKKNCGAPYQYQIQWDYDSFFSTASL